MQTRCSPWLDVWWQATLYTMMSTILAGDVGGTKSNLGLLLKEGPALRLVFQRRVPLATTLVDTGR
jgi:hypothetical protein